MGTGGNGIRFERAQRIYSADASFSSLRAQRLRSQLLQQFLHDAGGCDDIIDLTGLQRRSETAGNQHCAAIAHDQRRAKAARNHTRRQASGHRAGQDLSATHSGAAGLDAARGIKQRRCVPCGADALE